MYVLYLDLPGRKTNVGNIYYGFRNNILSFSALVSIW